MYIWQKLFLCLIFCFLVACGGGGGGSSDTSASTDETTNPEQPDSTTDVNTRIVLNENNYQVVFKEVFLATADRNNFREDNFKFATIGDFIADTPKPDTSACERDSSLPDTSTSVLNTITYTFEQCKLERVDIGVKAPVNILDSIEGSQLCATTNGEEVISDDTLNGVYKVTAVDIEREGNIPRSDMFKYEFMALNSLSEQQTLDGTLTQTVNFPEISDPTNVQTDLRIESFIKTLTNGTTQQLINHHSLGTIKVHSQGDCTYRTTLNGQYYSSALGGSVDYAVLEDIVYSNQLKYPLSGKIRINGANDTYISVNIIDSTMIEIQVLPSFEEPVDRTWVELLENL